MRYAPALAALASLLSASVAHAETRTICTAVADVVTGKPIVQEGTCEASVTPASTFKIAISLMGYDAGVLKDARTPELPFEEGYADWRPEWKQATDPTSWMAKSVVWYSQQITRSLGNERFQDYVAEFDYGNEDVSGDPGKHNGLTNAWLSSSLKISPLGQLEFLRKIVSRELAVSSDAFDMTAKLIDNGVQSSGWHVHGKTGAGLPTGADGAPQPGRPYGWFVGWATKGDRTVVFARLIQDSERQPTAPGARARETVMRDLFSAAGSL